MEAATLEVAYSRQVSIEHRKKFAQFFTPQPIADIMAEWLLGNRKLATVLEPAFGLGIFAKTLLEKKNGLRIKGFDVDDVILSAAKKSFSKVQEVALYKQDYMFNDWENKYDGIICNPPYFKFHDYNNKGILAEIGKRINYNLSGFTNLYTLFLLKSIYQLNSGGRCAYLIPSEFMNSDYGRHVKSLLLASGTLRYIIVFDFNGNVFDDALTTSCILLCANDGQAQSVQFLKIYNGHDLQTIKETINHYPFYTGSGQLYPFTDIDPDVKWKKYYEGTSEGSFKHIVSFSNYAKVVRGIATGANDYFTFSLSKARKFGIGKENLMPCICRCADVQGNVFTQNDFLTLSFQDKTVFLFNGVVNPSAQTVEYIKYGEANGIDKKYLTASRSPWYAIERRKPAPIWVSVFNRKGVRFVRNLAGVSNLTTFHCVYPQVSLYCDVDTDLLFAYLLTDTATMIFNDNCREYGNGLRKFEPNDLNGAKMLDINKLPNEGKKAVKEELFKYYDGDLYAPRRINGVFLDFFAAS